MGAWIEIVYSGGNLLGIYVAPLVGAWIEMHLTSAVEMLINVAPLVGAWIEIPLKSIERVRGIGRSPCGSVD